MVDPISVVGAARQVAKSDLVKPTIKVLGQAVADAVKAWIKDGATSRLENAVAQYECGEAIHGAETMKAFQLGNVMYVDWVTVAADVATYDRARTDLCQAALCAILARDPLRRELLEAARLMSTSQATAFVEYVMHSDKAELEREIDSLETTYQLFELDWNSPQVKRNRQIAMVVAVTWGLIMLNVFSGLFFEYGLIDRLFAQGSWLHELGDLLPIPLMVIATWGWMSRQGDLPRRFTTKGRSLCIYVQQINGVVWPAAET